MTREEAIAELSYIADEMPSMECADWKEAICMAIKALEHPEKNVIEVVPCGDAISRQKVLEIQAKYAEYVGATKFWQMRDDIKALPSVTPQPKMGHWFAWKPEDDAWRTTCSECGEETRTLWNYCPNCGAKMEVEE